MGDLASSILLSSRAGGIPTTCSSPCRAGAWDSRKNPWSKPIRGRLETTESKSKILGSSKAHLWQNLAASGEAGYDASIDLRGRKWVSAEKEGCDPVVLDDEEAETPTAVFNESCTTAEVGNNEVFEFFRDVQMIEVGCNRNLNLRMNPGVSGAISLKVVVKNYLTAEDSNDAAVGYTFYSQDHTGRPREFIHLSSS